MATQISNIHYNKFDTEKTLLENNKYSVELLLDDLQVRFSFTSKYSPLYSTADIILGDIGPFIIDFTDDEINQQIHNVSVEAQNLAVATGDTAIMGGTAFDFDKPPYSVRQYVRYKTAYNLAKKQYMNIARSAGSKKSLGNLSIDHNFSLKDLKDLLKMLKDEVTPWLKKLKGGMVPTMHVVKAGNHDSYLTSERVDF